METKLCFSARGVTLRLIAYTPAVSRLIALIAIPRVVKTRMSR
jgi:hypothetical protein